MSKPFYQSKTLWANVLSLAVFVADQLGVKVVPVDAGHQVLIMAVLNVVLRLFTHSAVAVK